MSFIKCPCGETIKTFPSRVNRKKYCNRICFYKYRARPSGLRYRIKKENPTWYKEGQSPWNTGLERREGTREKISNSLIGVHSSIATEFKKGQMAGKKNVNWKGGVTLLTQQIRHCLEYKVWILAVFERDNYICQNCKERGGKLNAHHIKQFQDIIEEYNIQSLEQALQCKELWDIDNGSTFCEKCHKKYHKKYEK